MTTTPISLRILGTAILIAGAALTSACNDPEKMLAEQADQVCACDTYECGMKVLEGPINQKLKEMDNNGKTELSDEGKRHKTRMLGCLLNLRSKDADGPTVPAVAPSEPAKELPAYSSTAGGYSVRFPLGAPKETTSVDGKKITWNEAKSEVGAYTISYADFASEALAQVYVAGFIKTMAGDTSGNQEITLGTHKGRELTMIVSPTATMWLRMFVVGKRVYKLAAGTKNDKPRAYEFLDSFKLAT